MSLMLDGLRVFIGLGIPILAGLLLLTHLSGFRVSERLALAFGVGTGWLILVMFLECLLHIRLTVWTVAGPMLIGAAVVGYCIAPTPLVAIPDSPQHPRWHWSPRLRVAATLVATLVITWSVAVMLISCVAVPLGGHDVFHHWGYLAKGVFTERRIPFERLTTLQYYPPLFPLSGGWLYLSMGRVAEGCLKLTNVGFFLALVTVLITFMRRLGADQLVALWTTAILVVFGTNTLLAYTSSGLADVPLTFYLFAGTVYLYLWLRTESVGLLAVGAGLLALAAWTKSEGAPLAVLTLLCAGYGARQMDRASRRMWILFGMLSLTVIACWYGFCVLKGFPIGTHHVDFRHLGEWPHRLPYAVFSSLLGFAWTDVWGLSWFLFAAIGITSLSSGRLRAPEGFLVMTLATHIAFVVFTAVTSEYDAFSKPWASAVAEQMWMSKRLILHFYPIAVAYLGIVVAGLGSSFHEAPAHSADRRCVTS